MVAVHDLLAQIRDVLATLYLDPGMARIVAQDAGLDLRGVEYSERPLEHWESILEEAQKQDRVGAILEIAASQYPVQPELQRVREAWAARGAPATAAPPPSRPSPRRALWVPGLLAGAVLVIVIFAIVRSNGSLFPRPREPPHPHPPRPSPPP